MSQNVPAPPDARWPNIGSYAQKFNETRRRTSVRRVTRTVAARGPRRAVKVFVPWSESECRRKWKTLRDQHRRERQREKERRESGVGLLNYRPWRYSSILSFLNPFIDARAAGTNGWALDPQPSLLQVCDLGCSDDDDSYGW